MNLGVYLLPRLTIDFGAFHNLREDYLYWTSNRIPNLIGGRSTRRYGVLMLNGFTREGGINKVVCHHDGLTGSLGRL